MTYRRVMPRDLFNEAKLLKCLGQLSLLIEDDKCLKWALRLVHTTDRMRRFDIEQRGSDGGHFCTNVRLWCSGLQINVYTAMNSKSSYPLLFDKGRDGEGKVFNDNGTLTTEFTEYLDELVLT